MDVGEEIALHSGVQDEKGGDVALMTQVIEKLQQSIAVMAKNLGPAPVRSLLAPATAASDLNPTAILQQLLNPFASEEHQGWTGVSAFYGQEAEDKAVKAQKVSFHWRIAFFPMLGKGMFLAASAFLPSFQTTNTTLATLTSHHILVVSIFNDYSCSDLARHTCIKLLVDRLNTFAHLTVIECKERSVCLCVCVCLSFCLCACVFAFAPAFSLARELCEPAGWLIPSGFEAVVFCSVSMWANAIGDMGWLVALPVYLSLSLRVATALEQHAVRQEHSPPQVLTSCPALTTSTLWHLHRFALAAADYIVLLLTVQASSPNRAAKRDAQRKRKQRIKFSSAGLLPSHCALTTRAVPPTAVCGVPWECCCVSAVATEVGAWRNGTGARVEARGGHNDAAHPLQSQSRKWFVALLVQVAGLLLRCCVPPLP